MLVSSNLRIVTGISAFDMDQSGGLSREEVVAALEAEHGEIDPETVDPAVVQLFDGIFDHFDADKDGEITMKGRLLLVSRNLLTCGLDVCFRVEKSCQDGQETLKSRF